MKYNIGKTALKTDLPVKTVRYYADIGLVVPPDRSESGYRLYSEIEIKKLIFVKRCRDFGFSIDTCRELLGLYEDTNRSSRDVKSIVVQRISEIDTKLQQLHELKDELSGLAKACEGNDRPECPILKEFAR